MSGSSRRLPAEYEPQRAIWFSWPGNPETWPRTRRQAEEAYAEFVAAVSRLQAVELICRADDADTAQRRLEAARADLSVMSFHDWPTNDAWCRDHGPLFVKEGEGLAVVDFTYNAWGGKFPPWDEDDAVSARVSDLRKLPRYRLPTVGEGGALEINSEGLLITTESVWLNPNRNPGWTRAEAEALFAAELGVRETLWLPEGLVGDDTDGHIDTLTRFVDDRTVVSCVDAPDGVNRAVLEENNRLLRERLEVVPLPLPQPIRPENWREEVLPATYANFLIINDAVLVPTYAQPESDARALGILSELFPGRKAIGISSEHLILEGGALHCLSMQEPFP